MKTNKEFKRRIAQSKIKELTLANEEELKKLDVFIESFNRHFGGKKEKK